MFCVNFNYLERSLVKVFERFNKMRVDERVKTMNDESEQKK